MTWIRICLSFCLSLSASMALGDTIPFVSEGNVEPVVLESSNNEMGLSSTRQLTYGGLRSGEGYFSQDGKYLAFQSERDPENPFYQIFVLDLESGETKRVTPGIGKSTCAFFRPGTDQMLFASSHLDPDALQKQEEELERRRQGGSNRYEWDFDEEMDIFVAKRDGTGIVRITNARGYDAEAAFSPDGEWIVFGSNRAGFDPDLSDEDRARFEADPSYMMDLYMMRHDGSDVRRLTTTPGYDGGPFFSPDGTRIIWRRLDLSGHVAEVYSMKVDGSDVQQLTNFGEMSWAPYYHASGDYFVYASSRQGYDNFEVYMMRSDGQGDAVRVTHANGFDGLPVFSDDGRYLTWTTKRGGLSNQIFVASWNDTWAREKLGLPVMEPDQEITTTEISRSDLELHVQYLASESLAGRMTGTEGERLATEYFKNVLRYSGVEGFFSGSFFQPFEFTAGVNLGEDNALVASDGTAWQVDREWRPLAFSADGSFENANIAFAGYGIVAPASGEHPAYDSYIHLDVEDKWVMMFRFVPENIDPNYKLHLNRHAGLRKKAMEARNRGAKGIIIVSGPNSQVQDQLVALNWDASSAGLASMQAISVSDQLAQSLLTGTSITLADVQTRLDRGDGVMGFAVPGTISGQVQIVKERKIGRNAVGVLPANAMIDGKPAPSKGMIIIGAHIDHLGHHVDAHDDDGIHYGADDNASGTAAVLELAQYFAAMRAEGFTSEFDLVFAAWSGEEMGLLGSAYFVREFAAAHNDAVYPHIAATLNMDMVGRMTDKLHLQAVGSSGVWGGVIESINMTRRMPLSLQKDPYLPTDSTSFYLKGVPTLNAFTGSHDDYHTPRDTFDKLNYEGLERVTDFMGGVMENLSQRDAAPDYIRVEDQGGGASFRAYLGTIPDYTANDVVGVLLAGIKPESPAATAGLQAGDIIVALDGQTIENIYDYTYALAAVRIGVATTIKIRRGEEVLELDITPASRN